MSYDNFPMAKPKEIRVDSVDPDGVAHCTVTVHPIAYTKEVHVKFTLYKRPWWSAILVRVLLVLHLPIPRWLP